MATVRVKLLPGRVHYASGSVHPFREGDEFDAPADLAALLIEQKHVEAVVVAAAPSAEAAPAVAEPAAPPAH